MRRPPRTVPQAAQLLRRTRLGKLRANATLACDEDKATRRTMNHPDMHDGNWKAMRREAAESLRRARPKAVHSNRDPETQAVFNLGSPIDL